MSHFGERSNSQNFSQQHAIVGTQKCSTNNLHFQSVYDKTVMIQKQSSQPNYAITSIHAQPSHRKRETPHVNPFLSGGCIAGTQEEAPISKPTKVQKDYDTWCSQVVSNPSTNQARRGLTSLIRREVVLSSWYGRNSCLFLMTEFTEFFQSIH